MFFELFAMGVLGRQEYGFGAKFLVVTHFVAGKTSPRGSKDAHPCASKILVKRAMCWSLSSVGVLGGTGYNFGV